MQVGDKNMLESAHSGTVIPLETAIPGASASLDSILRTEELSKRPHRPPDYQKETFALTALVQALADSPGSILQTLADKVLAVLQAGSAGLSLVTNDGKRFYWAAIAGAWRPHIGGGTPRDFGPCGDVLDQNVPLLFSHWEQRYPYLSLAVPLAEEGLLVPFYVSGKAVGTIWAIAHDERRKFDAEDLRLLESMGRFASAAYQTVEFVESLRSEVAAREQAEMELRKVTGTLEAQVLERTEQLRVSEAFRAQAQRLSRVGSFSWQVANDEVTGSEELECIFELDPGTPLTLELIRSRIHPHDAGTWSDMVGQARSASRGLDTARALDYEYRLQMPDGSVKYIHMIARAAVGPNTALEYVGAVQDMTEHRAAQEALGTARSELARAARLATLAEFSAAIAHEVNQPLAAVASNASASLRWLSAEPPNLERARLTAERVVRDAKSAAEVVNGVRALFKQSTPAMTVLNLNEVIAEVRRLMLDETSGGDVSIETDLERDLPRTSADRVQLQQLLVNLLRNGIEAMEETMTPKLLLIRSRREGNDHLRVEVCDRGPGLKDADNAFRPSFTTKKAGMGMGLAICRSIVEGHRGRLWAKQNEGGGATFCFTLPMLASQLQ
jgi:C4-dicarboxylate-specific signal transduction histidine kinase